MYFEQAEEDEHETEENGEANTAAKPTKLSTVVVAKSLPEFLARISMENYIITFG